MAKNPNWTRERKCCDCGTVELVRKDNKAIRCLSCASKIRGAVGLKTIIANASKCTCDKCGVKFSRNKSAIEKNKRNFCSLECKASYYGVSRQCKTCGNEFRVNRGRLSGKTNSSATFCCRACYEKWLCQTERINGRGSQWRKARAHALKNSPFCGHCGSLNIKRLQVHHIVPFRLTRNNSQDNLIPLCLSCHKRIESAVHELENANLGVELIGEYFRTMLRARQSATRTIIAGLIHARQTKANQLR